MYEYGLLKEKARLSQSGFDHSDEEQQVDQTQNSFDKQINNLNIELPTAIPLPDKHYSLEPDMAFGWVPKIRFNGPINLSFTSKVNDQISEQILYYDTQYKLMYLGFRPKDSIRLHKEYSSKGQYQFRWERLLENQNQAHLFPLAMKENAIYKPHPKHGMILNNRVEFESTFESGNLDLVVEVANNEYDLFMRVDSNTRGHFSWFNFRVKATESHRVKFNICNFTKAKCLYVKGMRPYVKQGDKEWVQAGFNICFQEQALRYDWVDYSRRYYSLKFELDLVKNQQTQIAYCVPYEYSKLINLIKEISLYNFVHVGKLCQDLSGIDVPLLTFNEFNEEQGKKIIVIQARIHPGESNGSWIMHGLLQFLISDKCTELRKRCIIKIIPMVNPDGVILGNYRTGMAGCDLNRKFIDTDQLLYPTVSAIKQLIKSLYDQHGSNLLAFIDIHGHGIKKNVFIYGPEFPVYDSNYLKSRILPKLLDDKTEMFRYYSCIFRISKGKKSTARGVFCENYGFPNCFTIEASNGFYWSEQLSQNIEFTHEKWIEMGKTLGEALGEMVQQLVLIEELLAQRIQQRHDQKTKNEIEQIPQNNKDFIQLLMPTQKNLKITNQRRSKSCTNSLKSLNTKQNQDINPQDYLKGTKFQDLWDTLIKDNHKEQQSEGGSDSESDEDDQTLEEMLEWRKKLVKQVQKNFSPSPKIKSFQKKPKQQYSQMNIKKPPQPVYISQRPNKIETKVLEQKPKKKQMIDLNLKKPLPFIQSAKNSQRNTEIEKFDKPFTSVISQGSKRQQPVQLVMSKPIMLINQYGDQTQSNFRSNMTQSFVNQCTDIDKGERRPQTGLFQDKVLITKNFSQTKNEQIKIQDECITTQKKKQKKNSLQGDSPYETSDSYLPSKVMTAVALNYMLPNSPEKKTYSHQKTIRTGERLISIGDAPLQNKKQNCPSAFYSLKKHLFQKRKQQEGFQQLSFKQDNFTTMMMRVEQLNNKS